MTSLANRHFLITGAGGDIGSAVADHLLELGADVTLSDLSTERFRPTLSGETWVATDLTQPSAVARLVGLAEDRRPLDGVVHCAAMGTNGDLLDCSPATFETVLKVNLSSTFYLLTTVAKSLKPRGQGCMIAFASGAGLRPNAGVVPYGAAKAGVIALVRCLALEMAPHGVRAITLIPGPTDSPLLHSVAGPAVHKLRQHTMLGRLALPREIATATSFLLDDQRAGFITGTEWVVDGGFSTNGVDLRSRGSTPNDAPGDVPH